MFYEGCEFFVVKFGNIKMFCKVLVMEIFEDLLGCDFFFDVVLFCIVFVGFLFIDFFEWDIGERDEK